jgi:hypothetical protein
MASAVQAREKGTVKLRTALLHFSYYPDALPAKLESRTLEYIMDNDANELYSSALSR